MQIVVIKFGRVFNNLRLNCITVLWSGRGMCTRLSVRHASDLFDIAAWLYRWLLEQLCAVCACVCTGWIPVAEACLSARPGLDNLGSIACGKSTFPVYSHCLCDWLLHKRSSSVPKVPQSSAWKAQTCSYIMARRSSISFVVRKDIQDFSWSPAGETHVSFRITEAQKNWFKKKLFSGTALLPSIKK